MIIRRYTCKDMQEALLKVKMDLGSEAVIMNSRKVRPKGLRGLFSKPMIEVVAAVDDDYVRPLQKSVSRQNQPIKPVPQQQYDLKQYINPDMKLNRETPLNEQNITRASEPDIQKENCQNGDLLFNSNQNSKIIDLENKVKSMEKIINQIYHAVKDKDKEQAEPAGNDKAASQEPPTACEEAVSKLEEILFEHDLEPKLIQKIIDKIRERGGQNLTTEEVFSLASRIITILMGKPEPVCLNDEKKPHVVILIGPTGVGKTTTLAKIAADFTLNRNKKVGLITADTYRIAAVEQLKTYAEILNIPLNVVYSPNEVGQAIESLSDNDLILIDTAGRSHKNKKDFDELKALVSAVNADETYLVMSCNTSRKAIREILEYYAFVRNYKLLFTKLDETPVTGVIINARYLTGKPLSYTTSGQSVPDDLDIADINQLVSGVLTGTGNY
jgi:flagellar biosynthesis protein FlhF